jgi:hypothetical protein
MDLATVRYLTGDELRKWRRTLPRGSQRAVAQGSRPYPPAAEPTADGSGAVMSPPSRLPAATPRETFERTFDQIWGWAHKSKDEYLAMVRVMRTANPWQIAHLTDEQAAAMLEDGARKNVEAAVKRTFHKLGRGRELQIKTGGW